MESQGVLYLKTERQDAKTVFIQFETLPHSATYPRKGAFSVLNAHGDVPTEIIDVENSATEIKIPLPERRGASQLENNVVRNLMGV